jgi:hypothetical protein
MSAPGSGVLCRGKKMDPLTDALGVPLAGVCTERLKTNGSSFVAHLCLWK